MAESPVQIDERQEDVQGQAQSATPYPEPHDGVHPVHEVAVHTDKVITDVNDPRAVQVPEGVGASTAGHLSPLGEALKEGTVEERFERENASEETKPEETSTS